MKAFTLLLLRLATGLYLLAWSALKLQSTDRAIEISDKLYMGLASTPVIQHALGALGAVLAIFVLLGFLRTFSYLVMALTLAVGLAALGKAAGTPLDLAAGIDTASTLLPYVALVLAALAPLVWKKDDVVSIDRFLAWAEGRLAKDETAVASAAAVAAPVATEAPREEALASAASHEEPAHDAPAPVVKAEEEPAPAAEAHEDAAPAAEAPVAGEAAHEEPAPEVHAAEEHAAEEPAAEEPAAEEHGADGHGHEEEAAAHPVEPHKPEAHAASTAIH